MGRCVRDILIRILALIIVLVFSLFLLLVAVLCRSATPGHSRAQGSLRKQQANAVYFRRRGIRPYADGTTLGDPAPLVTYQRDRCWF